MKYIKPRPFTDPAIAARKLVAMAPATEAVQHGRIQIEKINAPFLNEGGTSEEFSAGLRSAVDGGWLWKHHSGS